MRREYTNYMPELPIKISLINIEEYPIHWHDSVEIIFVLKGAITAFIETGKFEIEQGELEIINCDEAHSLKELDKDNEILMLHIDPSFFEKYFNGIKDVSFYTNSTDIGAQEDEKYQILRRFISIVACEVIQKSDDHEDYIEEALVELLYHLINNFHQLIYEKEDLKDNEEQFERYDRIVRYIYNNYKNKIMLQDIAKKEFLSSNYLSHEIKNMVGYNFKDFLNLTRVEESIKLLLDTDKTISEISEELGFSHIRYFNKHFKIHHKCTPLQYRKKYKLDEKALEKQKVFKELELKNALNYISYYLEDYDRFNYEERIVKIHVDATKPGEAFEHKHNHIINLKQSNELLKETQKQYLINIQKDIGFRYIMLHELFSEDMGVVQGNNKFYNWFEIKQIISFIISINLRPFIIIDENLKAEGIKNILDSFIQYFREEYGDYELRKWKFIISKKLTMEDKIYIENRITDYFELVEEKIEEMPKDYIYDTCYMIPFIIQNHLDNNIVYFKAFDSIGEQTLINNEVFIGDDALINQMGIRKPSYYAYYLLSRLGEILVEKGEGYIITKQGEDIQILLYSYGEDIDKLISFENMLKGRGIKNTAERKFSINLINLFYDYEIIKYEINERLGSAYDSWVSLGRPKRLNEDEIELLKNTSFPKISFNFAKRSTVFNMVTKIKGYGAVLILLNKVQKHQY